MGGLTVFNKKLSSSKKNYYKYGLKLYAIIQSFKHQRHYLVQKEFVLITDHETMNYINEQHKLIVCLLCATKQPWQEEVIEQGVFKKRMRRLFFKRNLQELIMEDIQ